MRGEGEVFEDGHINVSRSTTAERDGPLLFVILNAATIPCCFSIYKSIVKEKSPK